jgi:DNA repair photolyase
MLVRNQDGISVKGCSIIYAPSRHAGEYAPLACNLYRGCGHACAYCCVPLMLHMKRVAIDAGAVQRPDSITRLRRDAARYQRAGVTEQMMLSLTSDPYHDGDTTPTRQTLEILIAHDWASAFFE